MKEVTEFSKMPINKIEQWEQKTDSAIFFDDEKAVAFQKAKDEENNPALILMFGNNSKENTIVLVDEQLKRLETFLAKR